MSIYKLDDNAKKYIKSVQTELYEFVKTLSVIPAPSCHEEKRTEFVKNYIASLGFNPEVDKAGNVIWKINVTESNPLVVYMAHLDVVFADTEALPLSEDENNIYSPGIGDDTLRLALLLFAARYAAKHNDNLPGILVVANTGEEGLGNLYGSRQLVDDYKERILQLITIDGNPDALITRAVGSHRYELTVKTEGGHSFNDFGKVNSIAVISAIVSDIYKMDIPKKENCKTTYNVGLINGGTSVNTIAQNASILFEYRSDDLECLNIMKAKFNEIVDKYKQNYNIEVKLIGDRPCMGDVDPVAFNKLRQRVFDVSDEIFGQLPKETSGSTDANYPLYLGIPAVCAGAGVAHKTHTREEYIEKSSFEKGLEFVLSLVMSSEL